MENACLFTKGGGQAFGKKETGTGLKARAGAFIRL